MTFFTQIAPYILTVAVLAGILLIATHEDRHGDERKSPHD